MAFSHFPPIMLFLLVNAAAGWTATRVAALVWGELPHFGRLATTAVVFCGEIIVVESVLGFCGLLTATTVASAVAVLCCGVALFCRARSPYPAESVGRRRTLCVRRAPGDANGTTARDDGSGTGFQPVRENDLLPKNDRLEACPTHHLSIIFAAPIFFLLLCVAVWAIVTPPPAGGDGFIYHLYFPAVWLKHAAIEYVPLPYGAQAATYYPMNTESLILWLMLPFHEDFLTNAVQLPFLLLCGALVAALAERAMGARRSSALAGGLVVVLIPAAVQQSVVARVDVAFSAWFLAAVFFLMEWNDRRRWRYAALAGAAFGLFAGTKSIGLLYGLLILAPFAWMLRRSSLKTMAVSALLFAAAAFAFGGFWYARNWIVTGNPMYPLNVGAGRVTVFAGAYGREAMRAFHATDPKEIPRIFDFFLGRGLGILFSASAAAGLALMAARRDFSRVRLYMLLLPFLMLALFWWVNPHNNLTNGRFLFPAFFLFGIAVAYVLSAFSGGWRWLAGAALAAAVVWSAAEHNDLLRIAREVVTTLAGANEGPLSPARGAAALLVAAGAAFGMGLLFRGRRAGAIFIAVFFLLLIPAINLTWEYHEAHKYEWYGAFPQGRAWAALNENVKVPLRIANCGGERAYGLFGTGLRNEVFSANVDARPGWQFHDYHLRIPENRRAAKIERPQFHRAAADEAAWIENLKAARADILFCAALDPISRGFMRHTPDGFTIEAEWAERDAEHFREVFRNEEARVYRFLGGKTRGAISKGKDFLSTDEHR